MSVTPIGNATFINQNAPVVSQTQANAQARFDLQNLLATQAANELAEEVAALRPTEETYKIDPQHQHERQKGEQEAGQQDQTREFSDENEEILDQDGGENLQERRFLDIKI